MKEKGILLLLIMNKHSFSRILLQASVSSPVSIDSLCLFFLHHPLSFLLSCLPTLHQGHHYRCHLSHPNCSFLWPLPTPSHLAPADPSLSSLVPFIDGSSSLSPAEDSSSPWPQIPTLVSPLNHWPLESAAFSTWISKRYLKRKHLQQTLDFLPLLPSYSSSTLISISTSWELCLHNISRVWPCLNHVYPYSLNPSRNVDLWVDVWQKPFVFSVSQAPWPSCCFLNKPPSLPPLDICYFLCLGCSFSIQPLAPLPTFFWFLLKCPLSKRSFLTALFKIAQLHPTSISLCLASFCPPWSTLLNGLSPQVISPMSAGMCLVCCCTTSTKMNKTRARICTQ